MKKLICILSLIITGVVFFSLDTVCFAESADEAETTQVQLNEQMVMALDWMQNSAEYRALCYQAYNIASVEVDQNLAQRKKHKKPLAIVLDCDETIIDNIPYDAGLVGNEGHYTYKGQDAWIQEARAAAMPGAVSFLQSIAKKNIAIFYVTNRNEKDQGEVTRKNLESLEFPYADKEHVLCKINTSDKRNRFAEISNKYDVLVYLGDNAGDFPIDVKGKETKERNQVIDANSSEFGVHFVVLPNPVYGDWEPAMAAKYWSLTPKEKDAARKNALTVWKQE